MDTAQIDAFRERHGLPQSFQAVAENYYLPVARWLARSAQGRDRYLLGINGGQGTGKSTLASFLETALCQQGQPTVALSIDDFYLSRAKRESLARDVHPLLATRGVPGTHDVALLTRCLSELKHSTDKTRVLLPQFSKADDDRAAARSPVTGAVKIILLEGWCVATPAQPNGALVEPVNALERDRDPDGRWRRWVNDQRRERYADVFAELDALLFLQAPSFAAIYRWRSEQEEKLRVSHGRPDSRTMSSDQLATFVEYFERLTRVALDVLPQTADVVLRLNEQHLCVGARYRDVLDGGG